MTDLIAIRTHRWGEEEERLLSALRAVPGHDLAVVFHNRPEGVVPPVDTVDVDDGWLAGAGLRHLADWGWRCGDYFYYALRTARPGHDRYWLIEPDVHFAGPAAGFFAACAESPADLLGYRVAEFRGAIAFARGLPKDLPPYRAIFALTRLSARAIDRLHGLRRAYSAGPVLPRFFANDELFVFSHAMADPDLSVGDLAELAPDWFRGAQFDTNPDILIDLLAAEGAAARVYHPVHGRASFKRAVATRLSPGAAFLRNVRAGLRQLDPGELDEIAEAAAARLRAELGRWHASRR